MQLSQLINVIISRQTQAVSQAGFGTGLILSVNAVFSGVRSYTSAADVLADFTSGQDEYKAAVKYFGQTPKPVTLKIGAALAKVSQVDTMTPVAVNTHAYAVTLVGFKNGISFTHTYTYTSDGSATISEIVAGLISLINADTSLHGVTATGSVTLIMTGIAGQPFTASVSDATNMVLVHTTANVGVVDSLAALSLSYDDDWYALISTFKSLDDVRNIAEYIESVYKIFGVSSSAAGLYDPASTTDIAYILKSASYFRSFVLYSGDAANYPEAAMFGRVLPTTPGSETWAFKTLAGVVVDRLGTTAINALKAKYCNYFVTVGGKNITLDGKVAGNEYIDIIRLIDLLRSRQMEEIFGTMTTNDKIPFTNGGITLVEADVRGVLSANQKLGGIAPDEADSSGNLVPGYTTDFPNVFDISANDRANRLLSGGTWSARLSGAIQAVIINGTVTV